ncbi:Checkpoint kinase 2 [Arachnomyces sp. PD_36]|nr:Checkpoint kinase 2 [Arachnomyces sp. PD_36]
MTTKAEWPKANASRDPHVDEFSVTVDGDTDLDISKSYGECLAHYRELLSLLSGESCRSLSLGEMNVTKALEQYGRLCIWGEETRAVIPCTSRGSLDDTLRKEIALKKTAIGILSKLQRLVQIASGVVKTSSDKNEDIPQCVSWGEDSESSSEEDESDNVETPHIKSPKLSVIFRHIAEDINSLYQMSLLISRPGFNRRYLRSAGKDDYDPRIAPYAYYDLRHISEKIRQWNQSPKCINDSELQAPSEILEHEAAAENTLLEEHRFLTQRLAKANTKRREQLLYWSLHPDKPPAVFDNILPNHTLEEKLKPPARHKEASPARAQVDTEPQESRSTMTKKSFSTVVASDILGTQSTVGPPRTTYAESAVGNKMSNRVPDIPDDARTRLSFECPYCHTTLGSEKMLKRSEWKRHVFRDLRPYICTIQDCQNPDKQYLSRRDWIYHEIQMHRRQWVCEEHKAKFPTKESFIQHIKKVHSTAQIDSQIPTLLEISERKMEEMDIVPCPLCPYQGRLTILGSHLAEHLESISLFVLPTEAEEGRTGSQNSQGADIGEYSSRMVDLDDSEGLPDSLHDDQPIQKEEEEVAQYSEPSLNRLQFLFKIDYITPNHENQPEIRSNDLNWRPPTIRQAIRTEHGGQWLRWTSSAKALSFLGCRSTVGLHEESHVLAPGGIPSWMPQLLPTSFRPTYSDPQCSGQALGPPTCLAGSLSLIMALAALSAPPVHMVEAINTSFKPPHWLPHPFVEDRPHGRGVVVSICPDPLAPEITAQVLREFEAGSYGPIIA